MSQSPIVGVEVIVMLYNAPDCLYTKCIFCINFYTINKKYYSDCVLFHSFMQKRDNPQEVATHVVPCSKIINLFILLCHENEKNVTSNLTVLLLQEHEENYLFH
jgi:hypothetical protein